MTAVGPNFGVARMTTLLLVIVLSNPRTCSGLNQVDKGIEAWFRVLGFTVSDGQYCVGMRRAYRKVSCSG